MHEEHFHQRLTEIRTVKHATKQEEYNEPLHELDFVV